jgi:L-malate glycosyltransferase
LQRLCDNINAAIRNIMKIMHIAPHLGGGVGRVLLSWLSRVHDDEHTIYCIDTISEQSRSLMQHMPVIAHSAMGNRLPKLLSAIADADIVVIHWWNTPFIYQLLINEELPPCRMILWSHVAGHAAPQIFTKKLVTYPDRFVVATPWSLQAPVLQALDGQWREEHVRLIFTCAGTERVQQVKRTAHDHFTVGYIGTVDYCKLHASFIPMSVAARIPGVRFVVCGGQRQAELHKEACDHGAGDAFVFTGQIENIADYLGGFDVFGYPLCANHYGTGEQALIEAMAAGLAVVVFNNGCEQNLVEDKVTGLIVENERAYTAALERLYADPVLRNRLGEQAQRYAHDHFSLEAMIAQWQKLFHETVLLDKKEHVWTGEHPLHGARLFIEVMGESGRMFNDSYSGTASAETADAAISRLDGSHRASTRGSVFHYRSFYPHDPLLNWWCGLLEREMGWSESAQSSFAIACKGGIGRALHGSPGKTDHGRPVIETARPCPLCGKRHATVIIDLRYALFENNPLAPAFPWVICESCGFSYYATPSLPEQFDAYYKAQSYYLSTTTSGSGTSSPPDIERYDDIAQCLIRHIDHRAKTVFDVGCGKGGLLSHLRKCGFSNLYAIDMVDGCIALIREHLKIPAERGSATRLPFTDVTPDILIYSHVLEHVYDPGAVLSEAYRRLDSGGIMYVEVPDASRYGEFCTIPFADLYFEHINHFDECHLTAIAEAAGFEKKETGKRLLVTATGSMVPCIYGIFRHAGQRSSFPAIAGTRALATRCYAYRERCQAAPLFAGLATLAKSGTPVYVWGMSQFAQLLLGMTELGSCKIKALIDSDTSKRGKRCAENCVMSPDVLEKAQPGDVVVLTGIGYQGQMRAYLKSIKFQGTEYKLDG